MKRIQGISLFLVVAFVGCERQSVEQPELTETVQRHSGLIHINQTDYTKDGEESTSYTIGAKFFGTDTDACRLEKIGACIITACAAAETPPHAGALTLSGGMLPALIDRMDDGEYLTYGDQKKLFDAGQTLQLDAEGGDIPAFSAELETPSQAELTSPLLVAPPHSLHVHRTVPLVLTWNAGEDPVGEARIVLRDNDPENDIEIACTFDASSSQGQVPVSVLDRLSEGVGELRFEMQTLQTVEVEGWAVDVATSHTGLMPDGQFAFGPITLR